MEEFIGIIANLIIGVVIASVIMGFILVFAWNWSMPAVFGLPEIGLLQAISLSFVGNILFKSNK